MNNRTVDYSDRSGTFTSVVIQHPRTDEGFYKPQQKSYLQNSGEIHVQFGNFEEEQELPSHNEFMLTQHNYSSKADLQKFNDTGDRSDFGFSQASSHFVDTKKEISQSFDLT